MSGPHTYISTACFHGECRSCRQTCKYCDASCGHGCHPAGEENLPEPWVDQARQIARQLYAHVLTYGVLPPDLVRRVSDNPGLFWLRGEEKPAGTWHGPGEEVR